MVLLLVLQGSKGEEQHGLSAVGILSKTFKNLKNMTATPNLCCQVLAALYHFSLQSNPIKYIYNLLL